MPDPYCYVMAFDLVRYRGHSLAKLPYAERLALLAQACEELRETDAWPSDWVQTWPESPLAGPRRGLREHETVLRDLRAPMGAPNAAIVAPRRR